VASRCSSLRQVLGQDKGCWCMSVAIAQGCSGMLAILVGPGSMQARTQLCGRALLTRCLGLRKSGTVTGGARAQERCGLPVTVRLRAGMQYKTFHGLPPLAAPEAEHGPHAQPAHGASAPAAAALPDMSAHRCAGASQAVKNGMQVWQDACTFMSVWVAAPAHHQVISAPHWIGLGSHARTAGRASTPTAGSGTRPAPAACSAPPGSATTGACQVGARCTTVRKATKRSALPLCLCLASPETPGPCTGSGLPSSRATPPE